LEGALLDGNDYSGLDKFEKAEKRNKRFFKRFLPAKIIQKIKE
jgi:hypothetical protein